MQSRSVPNKKTSQSNVLAFTILISAILIAASIIYYAERMSPKSNSAPNQAKNVQQQNDLGNAPTPNNQQQANIKQMVSIDDDPMMGDPKAPVTIVEFSDFECPFCGRFFKNTLPQIKKEYIDTGKVRLVYRDLPLGFHEPAATTEAIAAECAREQGGDATFFKYHDEIFNRTPANGVGINEEGLVSIAKDLGLNSDNFKSCLTSKKYKDEVAKDLQDAQSLGATGTPTFFIGKTNPDGKEFEGQKVVGAQPFSTFKNVIDSYLK